MLRTEGDFVRAVNESRDLTGLAVTFLKLWRSHANGVNSVTIPPEPFNLVFMPLKEEHMLSVGIFYTRTDHWSTPTYYDIDDDMFVEGYGAGDSNISGHESHSAEVRCDAFIDIPFKMLMSSTMEADIELMAHDDKAKIAEEARLKEIESLEAQLTKLKALR